ncbi:nuclear transport factor 2 family protein [Microbacterium sp. 4R-513]|uniref:nuclear transport factor 2 family protein n=1 Tax=Microbacterium sp. 4R-513 TaxID=2567934 RepID=UPI0013E1B35D|nr:nuclear transport factor 2 family protein [Microbacterium sp. 4R-513]QIG38861.1 nuclear transport factor 2 family protein [Microbacterium sp. 4R-513]
MEPSELVEQYLASVSNEPDAEARGEAIERLFTEDIRYVDQDGVVEGREDFIRRIDALAAMMGPTSRFSLTKPVQQADDAVLFHWQLGTPGEAPALTGADIALVKDDRIFRLYAVVD